MASAAAACFNERTFVLELLVLGGGILVLNTRKQTHKRAENGKSAAAL